MCGVANLNDSRTRRCPAGLGIAPEQLKVDNGVGRSYVDELLEDGRPLDCFHTGH